MRPILFSIIFLFTSATFANSQGRLPEKYQAIFASVDDLSVDFSQITYKKLRNRTVKRVGNAHFSKPSLFRWNFISNDGAIEEYYFDGQKLTHFREKEKIVNHYNTNATLTKDLTEVVNLVLDPKLLMNVYKIKESKSENGKTKVVFEPLNTEAADISSIFVTVLDKKKFIEDVQIFYTDGNNTKFEFKNPNYSVNDKSIFTFSRTGNFIVRHHG